MSTRHETLAEVYERLEREDIQPSWLMRLGLWIHAHRRIIIAALVAVIIFLAGLAGHELGILPEPINGWYEWLHMHSPIGPKMTATMVAWIFGWMW
jgi:hypothetical protein